MSTTVHNPSLIQAPSSSAAGVLSYLEEDDVNLKVRALQKIYQIIDLHWAEICDSLPVIEELSEDTSFPAATLAAAIASKCFYHLQEYNDALRLALCAGEYLDIALKNEYIETILSRCIDEYKSLRLQQEAQPEVTIDPRMENIIEQMFQRCYRDLCFEQSIGVALDTRRLDKVEESVCKAIEANKQQILGYTFNLCQNARNITPREFRLSVIEVLVKYYGTLADPDYSNVCFGLQYLNRPNDAADTLNKLLRGSEEDALLAYQIAFDLQETENQGFVLKVVAHLTPPTTAGGNVAPSAAAVAAPPPPATGTDTAATGEASAVTATTSNTPAEGTATAAGAAADPTAALAATSDTPGTNTPTTTAATAGVAALSINHQQQQQQQSSTSAISTATSATIADNSETTPEYEERMNKLKRIMVDGLDIDLSLNFLFKQAHTDMNILKDIKTAIEGRGNVLHNALVVSHAFMNSGTTRDTFLRENLDWLGKAKNWAKFTTVGSIGVVHKGHVHESMTLLQPYLPQGGQSASPYSEAGALYALGLIHANKGGTGDSKTITYLSDALRNGGNNEIVQHGACLGVGLAAMATGNEELFESLRAVLFTDSAVAGEGAALGIGLIMLGQSDSPLAQMVLPDLLNYLHDTSHEKIVRALSLAVAMTVYGKEESADVIIEQLSRDRDPIVRYGACYAVAMAYCGTADNASLRKLLHVAVSDVNDDVRRAAVTCIGFLMFRSPETVPKLVSLLAESFNPHVRYGACIAIGVACAGTAFKDAIDQLTPMLEDSVDFVRQGALLSMAMVLQQASEARSPSVKKFKDLLATITNDKHQPILAKSGAILAAGILEAGGCNVVISLHSRAGFLKMGGAVGMMLFLQHWYWYPLMPLLSLAFAPTMMIGLNKDFNMPTDFVLTCNAPPAMFAYPKVEEKKDDSKKMVATAVLSTTVKAKVREARKEAKKLGKTTSLDQEIPMERVASHMSTQSYLSLEAEKTEKPVEPKAKKPREPTSYQLTNPSRLIPTQVRFVSLPTETDNLPPPAAISTTGEQEESSSAMDTTETSGSSTVAVGEETAISAGAAAAAAGGDVPIAIATTTSAVPNQHRYLPVTRKSTPSGIIILIDTDPTEPENVTKVERINLGQEEDAEPPEPFEWDPNDNDE